jgi:hypothetical protein
VRDAVLDGELERLRDAVRLLESVVVTETEFVRLGDKVALLEAVIVDDTELVRLRDADSVVVLDCVGVELRDGLNDSDGVRFDTESD